MQRAQAERSGHPPVALTVGFALVTGLNVSAFAVLFTLEDRFRAITGLLVFDTQNGLTSAALVQQLPLYRGEARAAYLVFAAFDYLKPRA